MNPKLCFYGYSLFEKLAQLDQGLQNRHFCMLTTLEKRLLKIRFVMFLTHRLADLCLIHIRNDKKSQFNFLLDDLM